MTIPDTQREAWESIKHNLADSRRAVLSVIENHGDFGVSTYSISDILGWPINCVSGRVTELTKLGIIKDSGRRGVNPSGKRAILWCLNG